MAIDLWLNDKAKVRRLVDVGYAAGRRSGGLVVKVEEEFQKAKGEQCTQHRWKSNTCLELFYRDG